MFKVIPILEKDNFAKFAIEPLDAGFAHTLGSALRRVLLDAIEGGAITSVKIDGVNHQFSTIAGVTEDVIQILLNLKKIRVRVYSEKPIKLIIKAQGKKKVTAKDIEVVGDGEVVSKDELIATLTSASSKLNMEMSAQKGFGYLTSQENKTTEIGVMATDALFSPVIEVLYTVEPTRVGRRADFDKLILEITTDGIVPPRQALDKAALILSNLFKQVYEPLEAELVIEPEKKVPDELLKMSVEELDLPVRITNALRAIDIENVEQLINVPRINLMKAKNLGAKSIGMVSDKLAERGLALSEA